MAAEAAAAQCSEDAGDSQPICHYLPKETSLAGFLGHVQLGFARAQDAQGWKKLEQHLEKVFSSLASRSCSWDIVPPSQGIWPVEV